MITATLPGMTEKVSRISVLGDSECTISSVECDQYVLKQWFGNRTSEVLEQIKAWQDSDIDVDPIQHWPGDDNPADLVTKGKAKNEDVAGEKWQEGPIALKF